MSQSNNASSKPNTLPIRPQPPTAPTIRKADTAASSKQDLVVAMLRTSAGATIAAMMQATGWQQHSVRGFLAGVVRKKLKLRLKSEKMGATRVYRIAGSAASKSRRTSGRRRAA
jgi:hypothetical protein